MKVDRRLKIGFLNSLVAQNSERGSWTIANSYMAQALQSHCGDVTYIEPIHLPELKLDRRLREVTKLLLRKNLMLYHSFFVAKRYANVLNKRLAHSNFDLIFAPVGWTETALLKTALPVVFLEDANYAVLHDYYSDFSNLLSISHHQASVLAHMALSKAILLLYPSQWGADSAIKNYPVSEEEVHVVPFGANIDNPTATKVALGRKRSDSCRLFFVGVDWSRKGGEIAFETLLKLEEEQGIRAELIICGCVPPRSFLHERMRVIPYLNRKDTVQCRELERLYETADFFFLPTRNECYGFVFCEASSFGLPSIATDTGGVSGAVTNGENGYLLPPAARGSEYAELIARVFRDKQGYAILVKSTRATFETRLNWDAWGIVVSKLIHEMMERREKTSDEVRQEEFFGNQLF